MQAAAGVWPDCRLVINTLCWATQSTVVGRQHSSQIGFSVQADVNSKGGYTLVTLPRNVTPYRYSVDGTSDRVTYQKLITR